MKYFILFLLFFSTTYAQENAFKTIKTNENFNENQFLNAYKLPNNLQQYVASPLNITETNYRIVGINLTFKAFDINEIEKFIFTVYSNNDIVESGIPNNIIWTEEIQRFNYYCNKQTQIVGGINANDEGENVDLFFQNPIDLPTGNYWYTILAYTEQEPSLPIKLFYVQDIDYPTSFWSGTEWSVNGTTDIKHKLYGMKNYQMINTYPYKQSFGPEELDGWVISDLFPDGIRGFKPSQETFAETDDNQYSIKISTDRNIIDSQMFYNLTSPKFRFEANKTYQIKIKVHHAVFGNDYHMPTFDIVYVPDPPHLGFLQRLDGLFIGENNSGSNLNPIIHNDYFSTFGYEYTPTESIETRLGIHMELGDFGRGEIIDIWLDEFSIEDITNNLSTIDLSTKNKISIYPNPSNKYLNINSSNIINQVNIYSINGKLLISEKEKKFISINSLSNGIYFIEIELKNGVVDKQFFTKE